MEQRVQNTHREGGFGDLHAVVDNTPAEAARNAPTMQLLLAPHHGLHGVAAHSDGSLQRVGSDKGLRVRTGSRWIP